MNKGGDENKIKIFMEINYFLILLFFFVKCIYLILQLINKN